MTTFIITTMTGLDETLSKQPKTLFKSAKNGMIVAIKAHAQYRRHQADYVLLLRMSNRDLADIGITRVQVRKAKVRHAFGRVVSPSFSTVF